MKDFRDQIISKQAELISVLGGAILRMSGWCEAWEFLRPIFRSQAVAEFEIANPEIAFGDAAPSEVAVGYPVTAKDADGTTFDTYVQNIFEDGVIRAVGDEDCECELFERGGETPLGNKGDE